VGILRVREGRHERARLSSLGQWAEWCASTLLGSFVGAGVALGQGDQRVDVVMFRYDIQAFVVRNKVQSLAQSVALASARVLEKS
tara:strand:+ start:809 stop:1063 length:255 start_codon:yes stop_codon:yes gene_type:complete